MDKPTDPQLGERGRVLRDGDVVARLPIRPCRCGSSEWDAIGPRGNRDARCKACGTVYMIVDEVERRPNAEGTIERVHRHVRRPIDDSDDREVLFTINMGPDDQRPDHDPENDIYRPICVAQHLAPELDSAVYRYLRYCGKCRHKWDADYRWLYCPYCTARIGNYVFADGVAHWHPGASFDLSSPPEVWADGDEH